MATPQQNELIAQFMGLTHSSEAEAKQVLETANWDIEQATQLFFDSKDEDYEEDEPAAPSRAAAPSQPQPSGGRTVGGGASRFASFGDIRRSEERDDDNPEMFAGGEKSGLALQNQPDALDRIFKKAERKHDFPDEDEDELEEDRKPVSRFTGSGRTLGSDDTPSVVVQGEPSRQTMQVVERSLTFWRDGFSVEDGPLMRYDDPANAAALSLIESGRAPTSLLNVEFGQRAQVRIFKRMDEDYIPPKKTGKALFSGKGTRLGSPTPGVASSSAASPPSSTPAASTQGPATAAPSNTVAVDSNTPSTAIQIRLGDGTRLRSRFNTTHTVGDLYAFVNAASLESRTRDYVLQTTMPPRELKEHDKTLQEEGLLNSVVVQKWVR